MIKKDFSKILLFFSYALAGMNALCTAFVMSSILVLSADFYAISSSGTSSSAIYVMYYVSMGLVGLFGRRVLQVSKTTVLGRGCAIIGCMALTLLACFSKAGHLFGTIIMVTVFLAHGLDFPNLVRFLMQVIEPKKRVGFFSFKEGCTYLFSLSAPLISGYVSKKGCSSGFFLLNAGMYLLIFFTWYAVKQMTKGYKEVERVVLNSWFGEFKLLWRIQKLRVFTLCRMLNMAGYVLTMSLFPLMIAFFCKKNDVIFSIIQSRGQLLMSFSFVIASLLGMHFNKKARILPILIFVSAIGGFIAICTFMCSSFYMPLVYGAMILWGLGSFSVKVCCTTIGGAITPPQLMGAIVIAGDALIKIWSSIVSMIGITFFKCCFNAGSIKWGYGVAIILLTTGSLITPFFLMKLYRFIDSGESLEDMSDIISETIAQK
ncbi:hypothetical protein CLAVI_000925 [Candidatus Clavichlamydia salmonicola]|uniref:MFS transporter n=1 Tax=Candidatus Clavichlamydia salmonicola TaxID=469812 RepID=UPI002B2697D4|nr:MFS transporter [Candidatus Clavichlamydia salmonicola]MBF5051284.1 hypothetical protein [Candidatus Clavichlamydia salmonicola]